MNCVGFVLCGILVVLWWWRCRTRGRTRIRGNVPKGSMGWPLVGESLEFIACGRASKPLSFMHKRRALYGKVFKSHLFGRPIIISTDVEVNKAIMQNDSKAFVPFYPKTIVKLLGENSILLMSGDQHKRLHGLIGSFLKSPSLKMQITKDTERLVQDSFSCWKDSREIYIQDETKKISFQILVKVLLNIDGGEEMEFLRREFEEFIKGLISLPINLPGTRLHKSLKAKERLLKFLKTIMKDKIMNGRENIPMDISDILLNEMNATFGQGRMNIDSVSNNILEMMIPGEDSVPMLMTLAVKFLSDNPTSLKQLVEENMQLKKQKNTSHEPYTWSDYLSLSFTQNVINETLRMGNIVNALWRKAVKDVNIKGYIIPKEWCILASLTTVHLNEENYESPLNFDPWRWQGKEKIIQSTFTPFGGGQRLCPGLEFSRLQVSIFLHHLVTNFSWVAEEDTIITFPTVKLKKRLPIILSTISN